MKIFDKNSDGSITLSEFLETIGTNDQLREIKVIFGEDPDERVDNCSKDRIDSYGKAEPEELKNGLI